MYDYASPMHQSVGTVHMNSSRNLSRLIMMIPLLTNEFSMEIQFVGTWSVYKCTLYTLPGRQVIGMVKKIGK